MRKNTPAKRERDPTLDEVLMIVNKLTAKQISEKSGGLIGESTVYNWRKKKVFRPQHYTMEAALHSAGFRFSIVKERANGAARR